MSHPRKQQVKTVEKCPSRRFGFRVWAMLRLVLLAAIVAAAGILLVHDTWARWRASRPCITPSPVAGPFKGNTPHILMGVSQSGRMLHYVSIYDGEHPEPVVQVKAPGGEVEFGPTFKGNKEAARLFWEAIGAEAVIRRLAQ